jgi:hypothetical protein
MKGNVTQHVVPLNDLKEHNCISCLCECKPKVEEVDGGWLIIHNSYDGRELFELDHKPTGTGG